MYVGCAYFKIEKMNREEWMDGYEYMVEMSIGFGWLSRISKVNYYKVLLILVI